MSHIYEVEYDHYRFEVELNDDLEVVRITPQDTNIAGFLSNCDSKCVTAFFDIDALAYAAHEAAIEQARIDSARGK